MLSFAAAASVAVGVLGEAVREFLFRKPDETCFELAWAVASNIIVFAAVLVEAYCVFAAIRWTREEKRESDMAVAEANARAAEADFKVARIRQKLAPRRLSQESAEILTSSLVGKIPPIYLRAVGDAETRQYANDFHVALLKVSMIGSKVPEMAFAVSEDAMWRLGVQVYLPPPLIETAYHNQRVDPLVVALENAGVKVSQTFSCSWPPSNLWSPHWEQNRILIIGPKPPENLNEESFP